MMDYELFKDVVAEKFLSYMPKDYQGMEVKVAPVEKVNRILDGLSLLLIFTGIVLIVAVLVDVVKKKK